MASAIAELPWLIHVPIALVFIAGVVLWAAGGKVIRPATITLGLAIGAVLGFLVLPLILPKLGISPYLGLVGGSVVGLLLAMFICRLATAVTFGSAIGAGCGFVAAAVVGATVSLPAAAALDEPDTGIGGGEQPVYVPPPVVDPRVRPAPRPWEMGPNPNDVENATTKPSAKPVKVAKTKKPPAKEPRAKPAPNPLPEKLPPGWVDPELPDDVVSREPMPTPKVVRATPVRTTPREVERVIEEEDAPSFGESAADRVGTFWWIARDTWSEWWTFVPARSRTIILSAAAAGLSIGTLLGFFFPAWAAGASTALVGAAAWMPAGLWLGKALHVPWIGGISLGAGGWLALWVVVALVGVGIQWYGLMPSSKGKKTKRVPKTGE